MNMMITMNGRLGEVMHPNPGGQAAFCDDWSHRYVALEGGWGSGKTWAGARKLLMLHMCNAFDNDQRMTYVPSAVVAPTFGNALDFALPALLHACEAAQLTVNWMSSRANLVIENLGTPGNPSLILIRSADMPARIAGWECGAFWCDEAARWKADRGNPLGDPLTQIKGRLRHPRARLLQGLFTYTNEGDDTAVYQEFRRGDDDHAVHRVATKENPVVAQFYQDQRRNLSPMLQAQYLDGAAVSHRGMRAYSQFEPARHVDANLALNDQLPLHVALDFNLNPGMHAVIGQHWPDRDLLTVVHEIHEPRLDVRGLMQLLRQLIERLGGWRWPELWVFGDATGKSQWAGTSESCYQIVRQALGLMQIKYAVKVPRSNPAVTDRVHALNAALLDFAGTAHWRCHARCVRLIGDLQKVRLGEDGGIDKRYSELSHASDAESYRVHWLRPLRSDRDLRPGRFGV